MICSHGIILVEVYLPPPEKRRDTHCDMPLHALQDTKNGWILYSSYMAQSAFFFFLFSILLLQFCSLLLQLRTPGAQQDEAFRQILSDSKVTYTTHIPIFLTCQRADQFVPTVLCILIDIKGYYCIHGILQHMFSGTALSMHHGMASLATNQYHHLQYNPLTQNQCFFARALLPCSIRPRN